MDKLKLKRNLKPDLDFVSPFPLEECVERLKGIATEGKYPYYGSPQVRVELKELDDDTYHVAIYRRRGRYGVYVKGYLKRGQENLTLVMGQGGRIRIGILAIAVTIFLTLSLPWIVSWLERGQSLDIPIIVGIPFMVVVTIAATSMVYRAEKYNCDQVIQLIESKLSQ